MYYPFFTKLISPVFGLLGLLCMGGGKPKESKKKANRRIHLVEMGRLRADVGCRKKPVR